MLCLLVPRAFLLGSIVSRGWANPDALLCAHGRTSLATRLLRRRCGRPFCFSTQGGRSSVRYKSTQPVHGRCLTINSTIAIAKAGLARSLISPSTTQTLSTLCRLIPRHDTPTLAIGVSQPPMKRQPASRSHSGAFHTAQPFRIYQACPGVGSVQKAASPMAGVFVISMPHRGSHAEGQRTF